MYIHDYVTVSFSEEKDVEDVASFVLAEAEVNWKDKKLLGGEARRFSQFLDSLWPLLAFKRPQLRHGKARYRL